MDGSERWLDTNEAADLWSRVTGRDVSGERVRSWCRRGRMTKVYGIRWQRFGRGYAIHEGDVMDYLRRCIERACDGLEAELKRRGVE